MRHALIMFTTKDKKVNTIDLGIVQNSTINKILDEFKRRTTTESISFTQIKKAEIFTKKTSENETEEETQTDQDSKAE